MKERILLSHGGGGILTKELVEKVFLPAYRSEPLSLLEDSAILEMNGGRIAYTTDVFVVKPLFFRGGDIGRLAVSGTVNDLCVCGASPLYLALGFVLEEGLEMEVLRRIAESIATTAREAEVEIVAGDTKVVEHGAADGLYITTTGIGIVPDGAAMGPRRIRPGDRVIFSGTLGDHGIAVLSEREGLRFQTPVESDAAPLGSLVKAALDAGEIHAMRDPTRGGAAGVLNEMAGTADVGVELLEEEIPVRSEVEAACEMLGLDPLSVANEGKIVAFVPEASADQVLGALHRHPLGREARIAGVVTKEHPKTVVLRTRLGSRKMVEMPHGEGLPRIC